MNLTRESERRDLRQKTERVKFPRAEYKAAKKLTIELFKKGVDRDTIQSETGMRRTTINHWIFSMTNKKQVVQEGYFNVMACKEKTWLV